MKNTTILSLTFLVGALCIAPSLAAVSDDGGVPFNGTSTGATVPGGKMFDLDCFTLAARVRLRQVDQPQIFINRGQSGTQFTLYLYKDHVRMLVEYAPGKYTHADAPTPEPNTWINYTGTYDGREICLYVNEKLAHKVEAAGRIPGSNENLYFGCVSPCLRVLDGRLDDVQIWNRALSADEIAEVSAGTGAESLDQGLLGRWTAQSLDGHNWNNETGPAPAAEFEQDMPLIVGKDNGYRGIWYSNQKQNDEYVYKYSGGLGTYCMKHRPMAIYSKEANKTFFCYGGTDPGEKTLWHMVSYYDHATGMVPRPTILLDKHTTDAHDNPVISIDAQGRIWVFSSSHGTARPSYISVSKEPYSIDDFERVLVTNFSYTQPYYLAGQGFLFLHTRYGGGRRLFQMTSPDGRTWSEPEMLAHIEMGHYQISWPHGNKVGTAFNFHPAPDGLNWRTNLYYMETDDFGRTWRTADGQELSLPLTTPQNDALVHDYRSEKRNVYMKDLAFDAAGRPVILYVTSGGWEAGPKNDPRIWQTARWTGDEWDIQGSITSDNNYDSGSLYIEDNGLWRIIAPTQPGPQRYNPGGEVAVWTSRDLGKTWTMQSQLTLDSPYNHTYCRKPINAHPDFYALWADGHARQKSDSRLYFTNRAGDHVWRLPVKMTGEFAKPEIVEPASAETGR